MTLESAGHGLLVMALFRLNYILQNIDIKQIITIISFKKIIMARTELYFLVK